MAAAKGLLAKGKDLVSDVSALDCFTEKLRKLLVTSIQTAIEVCGKEGGFMENEKIKILFPKSLASMEKVLKKVGKEDKITDFESSVNRAAERAAPKLTEIFTKAIAALTIKDAKEIFESDDAAGTKYLQETCTEDLDKAITPHIEESLQGTGAHDSWTKMKKVLSKTPGMKSKGEGFDLIKYVVKETLTGVFKLAAEFENEYRKHLPKPKI